MIPLVTTLLGLVIDQVTNFGHLPKAIGDKLPIGEVQVHTFGFEFTTKLPGQLILGKVEFVTVIVKPQIAIFPEASVAVY